MPLVMIDWVIIDPMWGTEGLPTIGATREHYVRTVASTGRQHAGYHVNVIVCGCPRTIHGDERLPTKSYSVYPALNEITTHVDLNDSVEAWRLVSNLGIAGSNAPKRASSSAKEKVAIGIHVHRSSIRRVGNIDRTHPGRPAVRGTVEFAEITSKKAGPKLIDEPMTHTTEFVSIVNHSLSPPCPA